MSIEKFDKLDDSESSILMQEMTNQQAVRDTLKRTATDVLHPMGVCYNCQEHLESPDARFCDTDCKEDYEHEQRVIRAKWGRR